MPKFSQNYPKIILAIIAVTASEKCILKRGFTEISRPEFPTFYVCQSFFNFQTIYGYYLAWASEKSMKGTESGLQLRILAWNIIIAFLQHT